MDVGKCGSAVRLDGEAAKAERLRFHAERARGWLRHMAADDLPELPAGAEGQRMARFRPVVQGNDGRDGGTDRMLGQQKLRQGARHDLPIRMRGEHTLIEPVVCRAIKGAGLVGKHRLEREGQKIEAALPVGMEGERRIPVRLRTEHARLRQRQQSEAARAGKREPKRHLRKIDLRLRLRPCGVALNAEPGDRLEGRQDGVLPGDVYERAVLGAFRQTAPCALRDRVAGKRGQKVNGRIGKRILAVGKAHVQPGLLAQELRRVGGGPIVLTPGKNADGVALMRRQRRLCAQKFAECLHFRRDGLQAAVRAQKTKLTLARAPVIRRIV